MVAFFGFALAAGAVYSMTVLLFAYAVEDRYLAAALADEAARQQQHWQATWTWPPPLQADTRRFADPAAFPADLQASFAAEPWRREFAGEQGRHYHLQPFEVAGQRQWLVAEVSERLVFRRMRGTVVAWLGWTLLAALAVAGALGWWIASRSTAPLRELARQVAGMHPACLPASGLEFGKRRISEVEVLASGLDRLLERIAAFIDREQRFTHDASHELRTPLAVIRSAAESLQQQAALDQGGREAVQHIVRSTRQLQQTLDTLLDLAREAGRPEPGRSRLLPVLERVIVEQGSWHEDSDLELSVAVPAEACVDLPEPALQLLLVNLLGNALAHAGPGPDGRRRVWIDVAGEPSAQRLQIRNTALAPLSETDRDAFRKRPGSSGLGLGLAIVARLAERYAIELRSDPVPGQVQLSLPLSGSPAA